MHRDGGQALAHGALVARMDVDGVADVDRGGHAGVRQGERGGLAAAQLGEAVAVGPVVCQRPPGGKLHEQEGQVRVPELLAPVLDEALEAVGIGRGASCVFFALVPEHATHRQSLQRRDQAVVAQRRRVVGDRAGRRRELLDAGTPGTDQRHGTGRRVQAQVGGIAVDAAAAAVVGHAHGDPVGARAQHASGHGIAPGQLPTALAADALAVDPDLVAVVDLGQMQFGRAGRLRRGQLDALAHPHDAVDIGQPLAFPRARRLQRGPLGVDVAGRVPAGSIHPRERQAGLPGRHSPLQLLPQHGAEGGVVHGQRPDRRRQVRVAQGGAAAHPGLQHGAAPGGGDEADRDALHRLHPAGEVVTDRAELAHASRLGDHPRRRRDLRFRSHAGTQRHPQLAQSRILRRRHLLRAGVGLRQRPFHVGLAAQQPDVADQDVLQRDGLVAGHLQPVRTAGRQRIQLHAPAAIGTDASGGLAAAQRHGQRLAGRGLAPEAQGAVALQHHVLAEDLGQAHLGLGGGGQQGQDQGKDGLLHGREEGESMRALPRESMRESKDSVRARPWYCTVRVCSTRSGVAMTRTRSVRCVTRPGKRP